LTYIKAISQVNIQPFFIVVQHICPQGNNHSFGNTTISWRKRPFLGTTQLVLEIIQNICPWGKDHSSRNKPFPRNDSLYSFLDKSHPRERWRW
jgi:hypothetical protein